MMDIAELLRKPVKLEETIRTPAEVQSVMAMAAARIAELEAQIKAAQEQEPVAWARYLSSPHPECHSELRYRPSSEPAESYVPLYAASIPAPVSVPEGHVMVPARRYKDLIDCLEDMSSGSGGWDWESVLDEHRAMLAAAPTKENLP